GRPARDRADRHPDAFPTRRSSGLQFSVDSFMGGGASNSNTNDKDDIHKCGDAKPSVSLNVTTTSSGYTLSVNVIKGTHPISSDKDRKSTRLNSSHAKISYAVSCWK